MKVYAGIAQRVEHLISNQEVGSASAAVGSNPPSPLQKRMTPQDDQLAPVRGLAWGLMLSIAFWLALYLVVGLANG